MSDRECKRPGLSPLRKNVHLTEKPITIRYQETEKHTGKEIRIQKGDVGPRNRQTPQGPTVNWVQAEGGSGGTKGCG